MIKSHERHDTIKFDYIMVFAFQKKDEKLNFVQ